MQEPGKGRDLPSYVMQLDVLAPTADLDQICCQPAHTEISSWFLDWPGTHSVHNMHFPVEKLPENSEGKTSFYRLYM